MNIDEDGEKNDSRKILPKINCNKKLNETVNKFRIKNILYFNDPKIIIKRSPTNDNLINMNKSFKLSQEMVKDEIEKTNIFNLINSKRNEAINKDIRNNILEYEFKKILNSTKRHNLERKSKNKLLIDKLNMNNIYRIKYKNRETLSKSSIFKNKLLVTKIKDIKLLHKESLTNRKFLRNYNKSSFFNKTSLNMSFSNETLKSNNSMINIKQQTDNKNKFHDSLNAIEPKTTTLPLYQKKKQKEKEIFISKLNIKSPDDNQICKKIKLNNIDYMKKWDLSKSFSFDKLTGRKRETKNSIKIRFLERLIEYKPKYDFVLSNGNKAYINYPDLNKDFHHNKKYITKKFICNNANIMNNPGNNYNILNLLNEKKLEEQKIFDKKKVNKILEEFICFNKKRYKY